MGTKNVDPEEPTVCSVHYRKLHPTCNYCSSAPTVIRVTLSVEGAVMVATLCDKDARGEQTTSGLQNVPGTGDYYNVPALRELGLQVAEAIAVEAQKLEGKP